MELKLKAKMESFGECGWIAFIGNDHFKGTVVQGKTQEEAYKELLISLQVKISYDWGIPICELDENDEYTFIPTERDIIISYQLKNKISDAPIDADTIKKD